jgi:hypothetical protein
MEPTGHGIGIADRARLLQQHQERGLERIVGVGRVAEYLTADSEHHWSVTFHHRRESRICLSVVFAEEPPEDLAVREVANHSGSIPGIHRITLDVTLVDV